MRPRSDMLRGVDRKILQIGIWHMVAYNLTHLTQAQEQAVYGPIQDDEALFLFALIRVMRLARVLEIGGLHGYSARNFAAAVGDDGIVYSVDLEPTPVVAPNHRTIVKDARTLSAADVDNRPLDLVFFDCHNYEAQMAMFRSLRADGTITDATVLALHDTNLHSSKIVGHAYISRLPSTNL